jgi:hypothetical protein
LDKDGLRLPILCTSKNYQKALFYVNKAWTIMIKISYIGSVTQR